VFHVFAEELRQALHQHVERMRYAAQQLEVANRLLEPAAELSTSPPEPTLAVSEQPKVDPDLDSTHLPSTVVIQLPAKSKRKPRRSPPNAA
jgi:hypothetical protein